MALTKSGNLVSGEWTRETGNYEKWRAHTKMKMEVLTIF